MGGLVLDIIVGYFITLFRILARRRRTSKSKNWRQVNARVTRASYQEQAYAPRPFAEIVYTYQIDGDLYDGVDEKPFFSGSDARDYASRFTPGGTLVIRIEPTDPKTSVVRDEDQSKTIRH